jgi:Zn-dependent protease with chaperone function
MWSGLVTNVTGLGDFVTGGFFLFPSLTGFIAVQYKQVFANQNPSVDQFFGKSVRSFSIRLKSSCRIIYPSNPKEPVMGLVARFFSLFSCSKIDDLKDPSEYGAEKRLTEATALIEKFNPVIKIKIKDTPKIEAQSLLSVLYYIILSTGLIESKIFTNEDIKVLVAHELGHIIPKSYFSVLSRLAKMCMAVLLIIVFILFVGWGLAHEQHLAIYASYLLLIVFATVVFHGVMARNEEYKADRFAIIKAAISTEAFAQCFIKVKSLQSQKFESETFCVFIDRFLEGLLYEHPRVERRISKIRALNKIR